MEKLNKNKKHQTNVFVFLSKKLIYSLIDFHRNSQSAPVDLPQFAANIVAAPLAVPVPSFSHGFHSKSMTRE